MNTYALSLALHVACGTLALVTFWLAAVLRKGSAAHIRVGRIYLASMVGVMVSAVPLAVWAFALGKAVTGIFLLYLIVITATACWNAWRAMRDKRDVGRYTGAVYKSFAWLNIVAGAIVLALGIRFEQIILMGLSLVGLLVGPSMLRFAKRTAHGRQWWLVEHFSAIIGGGIATHIAFLSIGATRFFPPEWANYTQVFAWFGPLLVAQVVRFWLRRKYRAAAQPVAA